MNQHLEFGFGIDFRLRFRVDDAVPFHVRGSDRCRSVPNPFAFSCSLARQAGSDPTDSDVFQPQRN
jgi:hypothetical protein